MALNDLSQVTPKIIAGAVPVLRQNSIMPRLVMGDMQVTAAKRGSTIDVPIPSEYVVADVTPSENNSATQAMSPTTVPVPLNQWKYVPFNMTDKDFLEIADGVFPREVDAAVKAIANYVDEYLLGQYVHFYGVYGTAGTTPFGDEKPNDAAKLRAVLNNQLCPLEPRHVVLNADAEAAALSVPAFANMEWHGDPQAILDGKLNRRLGFYWWMNQNVPEHIAGDADAYAVNGNQAAGATTIPIQTGTGDFEVGDIITFANHSQTYTVVSQVSGTSVTIRPPLQVAVPTTTVISSLADHIANIAFHPGAFAFATRPLEQVTTGLGVLSEVVSDTISGLSMRLQIKYGEFMTLYTFDILFGGTVVRPEYGARFLG